MVFWGPHGLQRFHDLQLEDSRGCGYSIHFSIEKERTPVAGRKGTQHLDCYTVLFQHLQSRIKPALLRAVLGFGARTTCASELP